MGVKGLFTVLRPYAERIRMPYQEQRYAIDCYPLLYRFKEISHILEFLSSLPGTKILFVDGVPPKEKRGELQARRSLRENSAEKAKSLRDFLGTDAASELDSHALSILSTQAASYDAEAWSIKRGLLDELLVAVQEMGIEVRRCKGEADPDLVKAGVDGEVDVVVANDMDLFVGAVPVLWILHGNDLFEFRHLDICRQTGTSAWPDVAILAGYEKCMELRVCSAYQAVIWMRFYGSIERLFDRMPAIFEGHGLEEYQAARLFL